MNERFKRAWFSLEDRFFDLRHGINTRRFTADLAAAAGLANAQHDNSYQAVWTRNLRVLVREARRHGNPRVFVDVGAGKGKACIYAAQHFDEVVGVEYAPALLQAAEANRRRAGCSNVRLLLADATQYDLPDQATLVFLFNSFDGVVLGRFVSRNLERMRANGSLIAYANDMQRDTLSQLGLECLFREDARHISLWRVPPFVP